MLGRLQEDHSHKISNSQILDFFRRWIDKCWVVRRWSDSTCYILETLWQDKTSQKEDGWKRSNTGRFFPSFCHIQSFCLSACYPPVCVGKEGRQVLSCKKMGWKLWPEVIIVRYTVPYCTPYCTSVPHRTTLVLFAEVITPVTSCAPRQHPSILPHPSQHSEFKICFDFSKYLFWPKIFWVLLSVRSITIDFVAVLFLFCVCNDSI